MVPMVPGPSDGEWDADEQRKRWLEWSLRRKQGKKTDVPKPSTKPAIEPPDAIATKTVPEPASPLPKFMGLPTPETVQALLYANAAAVRAQQQSEAVIRAAALAETMKLKKQQDDEDDDDAALFLLDD